MTHRNAFLFVMLGVIVGAPHLSAQSGTAAAEGGFRPNRDYLLLQPFESIDTSSGNVILRFTDLSLPANGEQQLTFNRVFNNTLMGYNPQSWTFTIAGLPMQIILEPNAPVGAGIANSITGERTWAPKLRMPDGSQQWMTFVETPNTTSASAVANTTRWAITPHFWRFDRQANALYAPDGTVAIYDSSGRLAWFRDAFENVVSLTWSDAAPGPDQRPRTQLSIVQTIAPADRGITVLMDTGTMLPLEMTHGTATWTYTYSAPGALRVVQPPAGHPWQFDYIGNRIQKVTTPYGGTISYTYGYFTFNDPLPAGQAIIEALATRVADSQDGTGPKTWSFDYKIVAPGVSVAAGMIATLPSGQKIDHTYGATGDEYALAGGWHLTKRTVTDVDGVTVLEEEARETTELPAGRPNVPWYVPTFNHRTITRGGRVYQTHYDFDTSTPANFAHFHRPSTITETGPEVTALIPTAERTRTTELEYLHLTGSSGPYILGLTISELAKVGEGTTANVHTFLKEWTYDTDTGFRTSETIGGVKTEFTATPRGNVETAKVGDTNYNRTTSYTYSYGQVATTSAGGVTITRAINSDGTVASETMAGRTTAFEYDALGRTTKIDLPGDSAPIETDYEAATVTVTRGGLETITTLDGFGRAIRTVSPTGITVRTSYDPEGRVTYRGLPFVGTDQNVGTTIAYDGLGRVKSERHSDTKSRQFTYGAGTVTIRDEENRDYGLRIPGLWDSGRGESRPSARCEAAAVELSLWGRR
jgi:YD repeat-containing protein